MPNIDRREFIAAGTALAATSLSSALTRAAAAEEPRYRKAVKYHMIKDDQSVVERFQMIKDLGFDGIEIHTREKDPKSFVKAREKTGLPIHGVVNSSNPDIVRAIDLSRMYGGSSVLVVAGRVNKDNQYDKNYRETQAIIRKAIPHAEKHGIKILVENVWNNFLLSPMEMARYVDELDSPMVGVYFDVGNVVRFGWPQHWIRILGKRIGKLDIKEYSREKQKNEGLWKGFSVEIGEGDCDWSEVRKALEEIGYRGWATAEVRGGGRERMAEIAGRMDKALQIG
jgi:hexulose-6-phosphate isomerase